MCGDFEVEMFRERVLSFPCKLQAVVKLPWIEFFSGYNPVGGQVVDFCFLVQIIARW